MNLCNQALDGLTARIMFGPRSRGLCGPLLDQSFYGWHYAPHATGSVRRSSASGGRSRSAWLGGRFAETCGCWLQLEPVTQKTKQTQFRRTSVKSTPSKDETRSAAFAFEIRGLCSGPSLAPSLAVTPLSRSLAALSDRGEGFLCAPLYHGPATGRAGSALRWASAWFHKFTIVYRPTIPGPLPHGRGSEGSANKPLPGRMDDRYTPSGRGFLNTRTFAIKH